MLSVQEVRSLPELVLHEEEWSALLHSAHGSFFSSPDWMTTWLEAFWRERPIRFVLVREDGRLVGLAPFVEDRAGDLGRRPSLCFPVNPHSHVCEVLLGGGDGAAVLVALLSHLGPARPHFRVSLRHLDTSSRLAATLAEVAGPLGIAMHVHKRTQWAFSRLGTSWPDYLQGRSRHVRSELRRTRKRIDASGVVEVRSSASPGECRAAFEGVLRVESRSWKHEGRTSLAADRDGRVFHEALIQRCAAKGRARIYILCLDGTPIAHLMGVEHGRAFLALKTSYDRSYRDLSPGGVLVVEVLKDALQRGLEVVDFLGEADRWKVQLATGTGTHIDLCLFSRRNLACQACRFGHDRLKPLVRRWLPRAARSLSRMRGAGAEGR
jgi:CelD/BcsL family acetyltransferase involved in cellulose biosynthesis